MSDQLKNQHPAVPLDIPLPWQCAAWKKMIGGFESGLMPHAQIFCGRQGLGKHEFAAALSRYILCSSRADGRHCGVCRNCRLLDAGVHPDFLRIHPEKPTSQIKIESIRALNEFVGRTTESGIAKIILIERADQMNRSAANALLKNLEEPPLGTYFFLVSSREMQLPITIRSRCQRTRFQVPEKKIAIEWLKSQADSAECCELPMLLAAGAPLAALQMLFPEYQQRSKDFFSALDALATGRSNPVAEARALEQSRLTELLGWMSSWISGLIRAQNSSSIRIVETGYAGLDQLPERVHPTELLNFQSLVQRAFGDSLAVSNISKQLILENLLINWQRVVGGASRQA